MAALLAESNAPITVVDLKQPTADLVPSGTLRFRLVLVWAELRVHVCCLSASVRVCVSAASNEGGPACRLCRARPATTPHSCPGFYRTAHWASHKEVG